MDRCDYIIASRRVRIAGSAAATMMATLQSFKPFMADAACSCEPLVEITTDDAIEFRREDYSLLTEFELEDDLGRCSFFSCADGYALLIEGGGSRIHFLCDKGLKRVVTDAQPTLDSRYVSFLRFGLWFVINMAFVMTSCSAVHSSTIVCQGGAVMFLGESGTGKSTHTRLWIENIAGAELLNDDSPFVSADGDGIVVCGSAWSGKTHCYRNESYPLRAVVRLSQAPYNKISRLSRLQAIGALLPSLPPAFVYDKKLEDALLRVLSKVIAKVPVYHLECLPDAAAAQLSYKTVFGDEAATE